MTPPQWSAPAAADFAAEIDEAERYERGLLLKAAVCLVIAAVLGVLREAFLL